MVLENVDLFSPLLLLQFFNPNDPNPLDYSNKVVGEYTNVYEHVHKILS